MTTEQHDKVDKAMKEYEKYERKVQRYILFLMGGMRGLTQEKRYKRFAEAPDRIKQLEKEGRSEALEILHQFIYRDGEFEDMILDEEEKHKQTDIHLKCTVITNNVKFWLAAALFYIPEDTHREIMEMIAAGKDKINKANRVKIAVNLAKAFMIYCKARRIQMKEEKQRQKETKMLQKYGGYAGKSYPWSKLYYCRCGNKKPWMHGFPSSPPYNEIVKDGTQYRVVCHRCFRHTKKGSYQEVVEEWNTQIGIDYKKIIEYWKEIDYLLHLS